MRILPLIRARRENNSGTLRWKWGKGCVQGGYVEITTIDPWCVPAVHTPISVSYLLHNLNDVYSQILHSISIWWVYS